MQRFNFKLTDLWVALLGAIIGWSVGYVMQTPSILPSQKIQGLILGAVIGFLVLPVYRWLFLGREVVLDSAEISIFGSKIKVKTSEEHRLIGWKIFVEGATRISTQSLGEKDGSMREALTSLYELFDVIRTELKNQSPSLPEQNNAYTIESYALRMLNDALRPMLARWHPRLKSWENAGEDETDWALMGTCRNDLEQTRKKVLAYVRGLGKILEIHDLDNLLKPEDDEGSFPLISDNDLADEEAMISNYTDNAHRTAGWHIFVELVSRISTQPLPETSGRLREALNSLYSLYDLIRTEIKQLNPPLHKINNQAIVEPHDESSVEKISLSILNGKLRDFLSKWHPALLEWEKADKPETEWTEAEKFRTDLGNLQESLLQSAKQLGELINIKVDDYINV